MARGVPLSQKAKELIYTAHCCNESVNEIAARLELSPMTVRRIIREQGKAQEEKRAEMAKSGKIVKKDGNGGKLMALDGTGFEFTHVTPDGKSHRTKVEGHIARVAEMQYDSWCKNLDDECEFMRMVERKQDEVDEPVEDAVEEEQDDGRYDYYAELQNRANEMEEELAQNGEYISKLEDEIARLKDELANRKAESSPSNDVIAATEGEAPKLSSWFNGNGAFHVSWDEKPVYLLWAKGEHPRPYGVYRTMELAIKKLDELNDVAAFLGNNSAFEVEEVAWR